MPAFLACVPTALISQLSVALRGLRDDLDAHGVLGHPFGDASEMKEPPNPNSAANTSSPLRLPPRASRY